MRKLILAIGLLAGMVPLIAAADEVRATDGTGDRLLKTGLIAGTCGGVGWAIVTAAGLHAVGMVGVGTGVGAPAGAAAFVTGAVICAAGAATAYFEPELLGELETAHRKARRAAERHLLPYWLSAKTILTE